MSYLNLTTLKVVHLHNKTWPQLRPCHTLFNGLLHIQINETVLTPSCLIIIITKIIIMIASHDNEMNDIYNIILVHRIENR